MLGGYISIPAPVSYEYILMRQIFEQVKYSEKA